MIDFHNLQAQGLITIRQYGDNDLYIANYTPKVQYEKLWTPELMQCRGLIFKNDGTIMARPFPKFFNLEELDSIPDEPFQVFEKMDGSLGILYWMDNMPFIATRGSFNSEQALAGTHMLYEQYSFLFDKLNRSHTYLFEIIYPANRIVVDYGNMRDLVLLAVIDTQTGEEQPLPDIGFTRVKEYDPQFVKGEPTENKEGFVYRFKSGLRVKVKFEEYVRLHRIITGVSTKTVWEALATGTELNLERVPDEFYQWVKETKRELMRQYTDIMSQCLQDYKPLPSRKETALYFQTCMYPKILFAMYTGKNFEPMIWKMIKPQYEKPFYQEA